MAEKTLAEKLQLKPGMKAALLHVPDVLQERLGVPAGVTIVAIRGLPISYWSSPRTKPRRRSASRLCAPPSARRP